MKNMAKSPNTDRRMKTGTTPGGRPYTAFSRPGEPTSATVTSKGGRKVYTKNAGGNKAAGKQIQSATGSKSIAKGPTTKAKSKPKGDNTDQLERIFGPKPKGAKK